MTHWVSDQGPTFMEGPGGPGGVVVKELVLFGGLPPSGQ